MIDRNRNLIHDSLQVILYSHTHLCISFSITYSITGCAARKLTPKIEFSAYVNVRFLLYLPIAHARDNRSDAWLHDAGKSRGLPDAFSIEFYGKLTAEVAELPLAA